MKSYSLLLLLLISATICRDGTATYVKYIVYFDTLSHITSQEYDAPGDKEKKIYSYDSFGNQTLMSVYHTTSNNDTAWHLDQQEINKYDSHNHLTSDLGWVIVHGKKTYLHSDIYKYKYTKKRFKCSFKSWGQRDDTAYGLQLKGKERTLYYPRTTSDSVLISDVRDYPHFHFPNKSHEYYFYDKHNNKDSILVKALDSTGHWVNATSHKDIYNNYNQVTDMFSYLFNQQGESYLSYKAYYYYQSYHLKRKKSK